MCTNVEISQSIYWLLSKNILLSFLFVTEILKKSLLCMSNKSKSLFGALLYFPHIYMQSFISTLFRTVFFSICNSNKDCFLLQSSWNICLTSLWRRNEMTARDEKENCIMEVKCLENGTLMKIYFHMMASVLVCIGVHMCRFLCLRLILFAHTCTHPTIIHVSIRSFSSASLRHAVFPMVQFCSTFKLNNNKNNNRRHFNVRLQWFVVYLFFRSVFFLATSLSIFLSIRWFNHPNKRWN